MTSYRDYLARTERKRPDGTPVWPLRDSDLSKFYVSRHPQASSGEREICSTGKGLNP